jgi:small subunit ribosomal protein S13
MVEFTKDKLSLYKNFIKNVFEETEFPKEEDKRKNDEVKTNELRTVDNLKKDEFPTEDDKCMDDDLKEDELSTEDCLKKNDLKKDEFPTEDDKCTDDDLKKDELSTEKNEDERAKYAFTKDDLKKIEPIERKALYSFKDVVLYSNEFLYLSASKIRGVGRQRAKNVCSSLGLQLNLKVVYLNAFFFSLFSTFINELYSNELFLLRLHENHFRLLTATKSYASLKYSFGLPIRGQRTRSNAKTTKLKHPRKYLKLKPKKKLKKK